MHLHTSDQPALALGIGDVTCNWGTHICGLYETPAERDEIMLGILHAGLVAGDLLAFVPPEGGAPAFTRSWIEAFPQDAPALEAGAVQLLSPRDLYFPRGHFSPWDMEDALAAFYQDAQRGGPRSIRSGAQMDWACQKIPGVEHLMAYEARLNFMVRDRSWVTICLYDLTRFSGAIVMKVLQTHPYLVSGRVITENPYYQDPTAWLRANAPEFLERT